MHLNTYSRLILKLIFCAIILFKPWDSNSQDPPDKDLRHKPGVHAVYFEKPEGFDGSNYTELIDGALPDPLSCQDSEEKLFKLKMSYEETLIDEEELTETIQTEKSEWTEEDARNFEDELNNRLKDKLKEFLERSLETKLDVMDKLHSDLHFYLKDNWENTSQCKKCDRADYKCESSLYLHFVDTSSWDTKYIKGLFFINEDTDPNEVTQFFSPTLVSNAWVYFKFKCKCIIDDECISYRPYPQDFSINPIETTRTSTGQIDYTLSLLATGKSTGNAANIKIENFSDEVRNFSFAPSEISFSDKYQGFVTTEPITITVPPASQMTYDIPSMYCIDPHLEIPPEGTFLPCPETWNPDSDRVPEVIKIREEITRIIEKEELDLFIDTGPLTDLSTQELVWALVPESELLPGNACERIIDIYEANTGTPISTLSPDEQDIVYYKVALITDLIREAGQNLDIPGYGTPDLPDSTIHPDPASATSHPEIVETIEVISEGQTTGRIGHILISNPTDRTVRVKIGAGDLFMPVFGDQNMLISDIPEFTLAPGETKKIPLDGSFCADITELPVTKGEYMPPIQEWIGMPEVENEWTEQQKDPDFLYIPTQTSLPLDKAIEIIEEFKENPDTSEEDPCIEISFNDQVIIPGTDDPLPFPVDPNVHTSLSATLLLDAFRSFKDSYKQLKSEGKINTVMSGNPAQEELTVIQWLMWRYEQGLQQKNVGKDHFMSVSKTELEEKGGKKLEEYTEPQQELITDGLDGLFSVFDGVGVHAKKLKPGLEIPEIPVETQPVEQEPEEFVPDSFKSFLQVSPGTDIPISSPGAITSTPISNDDTARPGETEEGPDQITPAETTGGPTPTYAPEEQEPVCSIKLTPMVAPAMNGGLKRAFRASSYRIYRDDFIPLGAEGLDYDQIKWECEPEHNCPDTKGDRTIPLTGKVKFEWEIIEGEGNFVQLGCLPNLQNDVGDHVIFQPPFVPLEDGQSRNQKTTVILLKIIDDNSTQEIDDTVERRITIITLRRSSRPDVNEMTVSSENYSLPEAPERSFNEGTCLPGEPVWNKNDNLQFPVEEKPGVLDNDKMVVGQWIRLSSQDQTDPDELEMKCESDNCDPSETKEDYEDRLEWAWEIVTGGESGQFVTGSAKTSRDTKVKGQYVIYESPMKLEEDVNFKDIEIKIKLINPEDLQLEDIEKERSFTIRVYKAGIKLARAPLAWLPERENSLQLNSELQYHDGTDWQDGLAHMCRIHFFDLVDNSREKGYCSNAPEEDDANTCFDYRLAEGDGHELFNERRRDDNPGSRDCRERREYMLEARTKLAVKEYEITINSEDYGGYAKIFSLGNINKYDHRRQIREEPLYISIPVEANDHPLGRAKKQVYEDNRVTIPRDIDENQIADNGWMASVGNGRQRDPEDINVDADTTPRGDGLNEDGYTAYEEYRGFDVVQPAAGHVRTDLRKKDLMIWNDGEFSLTLFRTASGLTVHEVGEENLDRINNIYMSNFNSPTFNVHKQAGVKISERTRSGTLLGICDTVIPQGQTSQGPAPPNWVKEVRIYQRTIEDKEVVDEGFISYADFSAETAAHELGHACNVYHHGEHVNRSDISLCPPNNNVVNGPRSGNLACIMRYDNKRVCDCQDLEETVRQFEVGGRQRTHRAYVEPVGTNYCTGSAGTGYNANNQCFGNCAAGRGNCIRQFRVSGRHANFPNRR